LVVDQIVDAALRLGAKIGFEALTMRALADELGVSPMATYYHVPNKQALIELVIDAVLAKVEIPPPDFGDWDDRLYELHVRTTEVLSRYPGLEALIYGRPPTAQGWRLMDAYFQILLDGGFSRRNAVIAFSIIHAYGLGRTAMERGLPGKIEAERQYVEWPALCQIGDLWAQLHRPDYRAFAMESILDGLRVMLAKQGTDVTPPPRGRNAPSATSG